MALLKYDEDVSGVPCVRIACFLEGLQLSRSRNVLSLSNVTRQFPGFLLDRVSLSLRPGAVMGLLGPNGAGKTTMIKLILNLIRPDAGSTRVFGLDSQSHEIAIKRGIGYVGENTLLPPNGTARWLGSLLSVCFPSWDDNLYRHYLNRFRVPLNKPPRALSKGTRAKAIGIFAMVIFSLATPSMAAGPNAYSIAILFTVTLP